MHDSYEVNTTWLKKERKTIYASATKIQPYKVIRFSARPPEDEMKVTHIHPLSSPARCSHYIS